MKTYPLLQDATLALHSLSSTDSFLVWIEQFFLSFRVTFFITRNFTSLCQNKISLNLKEDLLAKSWWFVWLVGLGWVFFNWIHRNIARPGVFLNLFIGFEINIYFLFPWKFRVFFCLKRQFCFLFCRSTLSSLADRSVPCLLAPAG